MFSSGIPDRLPKSLCPELASYRHMAFYSAAGLAIGSRGRRRTRPVRLSGHGICRGSGQERENSRLRASSPDNASLPAERGLRAAAERPLLLCRGDWTDARNAGLRPAPWCHAGDSGFGVGCRTPVADSRISNLPGRAADRHRRASTGRFMDRRIAVSAFAAFRSPSRC